MYISHIHSFILQVFQHCLLVTRHVYLHPANGLILDTRLLLQVTFHKVVEAEVEAASRGASADEVAQMTGLPENARLVTLLKGGALSVTIKKGTAKQRSGTTANPSQPDLANQVSLVVCTVVTKSHRARG